jgi:hypothetical protein
MDPDELLKKLLECCDVLTKEVLEKSDQELALCDAVNGDNEEVMRSISYLVEGLGDLDGWIKRGGFLPAAWRNRQKQLELPPEQADLKQDLKDLLFPGGDPEHEWDSDTLGELGLIAEKYNLVPTD